MIGLDRVSGSALEVTYGAALLGSEILRTWIRSSHSPRRILNKPLKFLELLHITSPSSSAVGSSFLSLSSHLALSGCHSQRRQSKGPLSSAPLLSGTVLMVFLFLL